MNVAEFHRERSSVTALTVTLHVVRHSKEPVAYPIGRYRLFALTQTQSCRAFAHHVRAGSHCLSLSLDQQDISQTATFRQGKSRNGMENAMQHGAGGAVLSRPITAVPRSRMI